MYWHEGRDPAASRSPKSMRFSRVATLALVEYRSRSGSGVPFVHGILARMTQNVEYEFGHHFVQYQHTRIHKDRFLCFCSKRLIAENRNHGPRN